MNPLWTVAEAVAATGGRPEGLPEGPLSSISIDSRELGPDALFVAIQGEVRDGHDFVAMALASGAAAALVSETWFAAHGGERLIVVADPLEALNAMAGAARTRSQATFVAVTGSVGKTTTKEAIRTVLAAAGPTHASIRSYNNQWGVPLMLASMPREAEYGVFEIGMNHAGEITPLTRLVRPHIAVITAVAPAHLEFFRSVTEIAEAKAEIFLGLEEGGTAVLNADHDYLHILFAKAREADVAQIVTYGIESETDWRIEPVRANATGAAAQIVHGKDRFELQLKIIGNHMLANATAALAVAVTAGVAPAPALGALKDFGAPEGRGETTPLGPADKPLLLVDESYNANTASMRAAMEVFTSVHPPAGEKVLVLGDMLELGPTAEEQHRSLLDAVLATGATRIFLLGKAMKALGDALGPERVTGYAEQLEELSGTILGSLAYGDAVMVKGSKGVRLAFLVRSIRERFGTVA